MKIRRLTDPADSQLYALRPSFIVALVSGAVAASRADDCAWPRVDGRSMKWRDFLHHYYEKRPIVLEHLIDDWPAVSQGRWVRQKFLGAYGNHTFNSSHVADNCRRLTEFHDGESLEQHLNSNAKASWFVKPNHPLVVELQSRQDWTVPELLRHVVEEGPYISIGKTQQGNIFHAHRNNWIAQVTGRKRWHILEPSKLPAIESMMHRKHAGPCAPPPEWAELSACVVGPGDIMYLPSKYQHETCCLDEFNVAIAYIGTTLDPWTRTRKSELWLAVTEGNFSQLKKLFKESGMPYGSADLNISNAEGERLLHQASYKGHLSLVKWLIRKQADVRAAKNKNSWQAVHLSAQEGHFDVVKWLTKHRADLGAVDNQGKTPARWAAALGHVPILQFVIDHRFRIGKAGKVAIHSEIAAAIKEAVESGHGGCVDLLVKQSDLVGGPRGILMPSELLGIASKSGHELVTQLLLSYRAEVVGHSDENPMHFAAQEGHLRVLKLLLKMRGDVRLTNSKRTAAIHLAAKHGHVDALEYICGLRVDPGIKDNSFSQPLHLAAFSGHVLAATYLMKLRSDVNSEANGWRPIHAAVGGGHHLLVAKLIEYGADSEALGPSKATPARLAQKFGHAAVLRILKDAAKIKSNEKLPKTEL